MAKSSKPEVAKPSKAKADPAMSVRKASASFNKRSGGDQTMKSGRSMAVQDYGPTKSKGHEIVGDDSAGTRFTASLPPETEAMAAPEAEIPEIAAEMRAPVLPVRGCDDTGLDSIVGWDHKRDAQLGKQSKR